MTEKMFALRNIDPTLVTMCNHLRGLTKVQLGKDIIICDEAIIRITLWYI